MAFAMNRSRFLSSSAGTAWTILLFWLAQYGLLTAQRLLVKPDEGGSFLVARACVTLIGIALAFAMAYVLRAVRGWSARWQLGTAILLALVGCLLHAAGNFLVFDLFMRELNRANADVASYFMAVAHWFWSYAALAGFLLVLSFSQQASERERRIAQLRREADSAQMRALRYQLNPHFMFNTLNSVVALIGRRDIDTAEKMVENLSDFLRASLSLDPQDMIPLSREIELQSLYLSIESVRFADRLRIEFDIPADAGRALVPSLILQPLVENVIRYAVATSRVPILLVISATVAEGRLRLSVRNSSGDGSVIEPRGTGVGLANVQARLTAAFGAEAGFRTYRTVDGSFTADISIPLCERKEE
ncbi:sensor histidine kinase [Stakelama marina]|uniref:Histidine kinase n=1 Tax=Stakelama marina TaxID=2826939 RepID=A0A8T4INV3_9SPHN|nr:histidine kinase [Stakelama marina]MBR0553816.1 histidine kinase [Stakelama marina]